MTREIIFRGKRIDNGEWVEGFYVRLYDGKGNVSHRIYTGCAESDCGYFYPENFEVDPSTVGQYTGLTANGKKIFEGDIVVFTLCGELDSIGAVRWDTTFVGWRVAPFKGMYGMENIASYEIIGNVHDNPELLEGEG